VVVLGRREALEGGRICRRRRVPLFRRKKRKMRGSNQI
jgi:hypothetical protein